MQLFRRLDVFCTLSFNVENGRRLYIERTGNTLEVRAGPLFWSATLMGDNNGHNDADDESDGTVPFHSGTGRAA